MSVPPRNASESPGRPRTPRSADWMPELFPTDFGQYRLLGFLGQGGMGRVYKALHIHLNREVAIKVIRGRDPGGTGVQRFLQEMKALGRLVHPHVVHATDAGVWDDHHYLVMEYLNGSDLLKLVRALGRLPIADACELISQAALGLQYAHEKGLVHRDIKPSNLFVTREGVLKILDLGLVRIQDEVPAEGLTPSGAVLGTYDYMAPEQAADPHNADIRADLYSLGCTLYFLLSGTPPFSGPEYGSQTQKLFGHAQDQAQPVAEKRPEVPAALAAILDRLLAKRAEDRFEKPRDLETLLRPFAKGADPGRIVAEYRRCVPEEQPSTVPDGPAPREPSTVPQPSPPFRGKSRQLVAIGVGLSWFWSPSFVRSRPVSGSSASGRLVASSAGQRGNHQGDC